MRIDSPRMSNAIVTGSFSGSFTGEFIGDIQADSVDYANVLNKPTLVSGSDQINLVDTVGYSSFSSSLASDITSNSNSISALQSFSSSLGGDYATDAELASVSGALESHINSVESVSTANASKLAGIESGATADQTGAEIKALYEAEADTNAFTDALQSKLNAIEAGATADQTASEILTALKTVDGAGSGLDADLLDGQSSAYYATATALTNVSSSLASSITTEKGRIDAILDASSADKDSFAEIVTLINSVDLANDQAFAAYYTSSNGRLDALELESGSIDGRVSSLESTVGSLDSTYATDSQLSAVSGALEAHINAVETVSDANASKLAGIESGATADQTAAEIKTAYESNANTNAFTDAEKSKLDGIEAGATADQTAAEIKTAYESNANTNAFTDTLLSKLNAIEAGATADQTASEILTAIKTVDGAGSGLDADLLDGQSSAYYATATALTSASSSLASSITTQKGRIDAILASADADKDSFAEIVTLINSVDTTNDEAFAGYVLSNNSRVSALELESGSIDGRVSSLESTVSGLDGTYATDVALTALSSSLASDLSAIDTAVPAIIDNAGTPAFNTGITKAEILSLINVEDGATADQTAAEIKTLYESNLDTNAFDDAAVSKLAGIEAGAEVNTVDSVAGKTGTVTLVKGDVGLANVDNTSDANKPVSTAQQTALNLKANLASPTFTGTVSGITKAMVGLGNVDNTSDANKPVSTAQQTALNLKANLASPTFTGTVSGITKAMVGLGDVDNTSDANKPVSTAQQTALNLKANLASPALTGTPTAPTPADNDNSTKIATTAFVMREVSDLIGGAGAAFDTLLEISASLAAGDSNLAGLVDGKLSKSENLNDLTNKATARTNLELGSLATLSAVGSGEITDNSVGAAELNVSGNGTTAQYLRSDGDGSFTWATPTDTTYSVATDTVLGLIELFSNTDQTVAANAVTTTAGRTYGLQLNAANQGVVNVPWTDTTYSVGDGGLTEINFTSTLKTKLDGIEASANNYSLPNASSTVLGGIKIEDDTVQSVAANAVTATASRTYGIQVNASGQAVVNVPWVDTNTTYAVATSTVAGLIEVFSDTDQTVAANAVTATAGRTYGIQLNAANQAVVNVPWTDTTYTRASFINQDVNTTDNVHFEGLMVGQTTGATANTIRCVGDVVAYYSSDAQFKDNVQTLEGSLDKIKQIRGVRFDWNDKQDVHTGHDIGVIAQEVEKVLPELVHDREYNGSKAVDYVKLTAVLIEAVKELSAKIEELENKL